jgi:hypothetical protein
LRTHTTAAHRYIQGIDGRYWVDFFMTVPRWGRYADSSVEKFNDLSLGLRDKSAGQAVQVFVKLVNDTFVKRFEETVKRVTIAREERAGNITRRNADGDTVFTMGLLPKPLDRVQEALAVSTFHLPSHRQLCPARLSHLLHLTYVNTVH